MKTAHLLKKAFTYHQGGDLKRAEQLYGEILELSFIERLRDEQKFTRVEDLITQIKEDVGKTRQILRAD